MRGLTLFEVYQLANKHRSAVRFTFEPGQSLGQFPTRGIFRVKPLAKNWNGTWSVVLESPGGQMIAVTREHSKTLTVYRMP